MSTTPGIPPAVSERPFLEVPPRTFFRSIQEAPRSPTGRALAAILSQAGVTVNGNRPWDVRVHDERFYGRVLMDGNLGAGESYVDGWWEADALDEFFDRIQRAGTENQVGDWSVRWLALKARVFNRQTRRRSREVAEEHYDLGNDLYQAMLDRHMQYTCAYWKDARTLDAAQENKLHLVCRKLGLQPGMTVLELGSGFGGLARFMASEYGCRVASYNISHEQVAYAREICAGLPVRVELRDYREAIHEPEQFDRVVSIGLCEHLGQKNYRGFLALANSRLKPGGLFLLHTIGGNRSYTCTDPWIDRYIFPNGVIPSIRQIGEAAEGLWVMEDWHNFGPDYDRTLMAWWNNFDTAWPKLRERYGGRFYRMWKYYLLSSAGAFRSRRLQLWQIVFSKGDVPGYQPVR